MNWNWIMPWKRFTRPDKSSDRADQILAQVRRQQPEVDQITQNIKERQQVNSFSKLWEQGLKGGPQ